MVPLYCVNISKWRIYTPKCALKQSIKSNFMWRRKRLLLRFFYNVHMLHHLVGLVITCDKITGKTIEMKQKKNNHSRCRFFYKYLLYCISQHIASETVPFPRFCHFDYTLHCYSFNVYKNKVLLDALHYE